MRILRWYTWYISDFFQGLRRFPDCGESLQTSVMRNCFFFCHVRVPMRILRWYTLQEFERVIVYFDQEWHIFLCRVVDVWVFGDPWY